MDLSNRSLHGYVSYGEGSPLSDAIGAMWGLFGIVKRPLSEAAGASLVLLDHVSVKDPIALRDIEPFRSSLGGERKKVFRITSLARASAEPPFPPSRGRSYAWMLSGDTYDMRCLEILEWIAIVDHSVKDAPAPPLPDVDSCKALLTEALEIQDLGVLPALLGNSGKFKITLEELARAGSTPELYECLLRLSADFALYDHDVVKVLDHPFGRQGSLPDALMTHRVREVCEDLRSSLLNLVEQPGPTEPNCILLIDDKHREFGPLLSLLQSSLLRGFHLLIWNPLADGEKQAFERICAYRSLDFQGVSDLKLRVEPLTSPVAHGRNPAERPAVSESSLVSLKEILPRLQFIVVDQLFRTDERFEFRGHDLIRGLGRIVRDQDREARTPEMIGLSRTGSPDAINRALQAGARDYVEKSHLIALPGVLARTQRTVSEPRTSLGRNFSRLYHLPNEVVGWLRKAVIPPDGLEERTRKSESTQKVHALLSAIPKTDLHIHVGSCMSTEFLVVASLIGLFQREQMTADYRQVVGCFSEAIGENPVAFPVKLNDQGLGFAVAFSGGSDWILSLAKEVRRGLGQQVRELSKTRRGSERDAKYRSLRSILHKELRISDYKSDSEVMSALRTNVDNLSLAWFAVRHRDGVEKPLQLDQDTLVRLYLLVLAASKYQNATLRIGPRKRDILGWFRRGWKWSISDAQLWADVRQDFYEVAEGVTPESAGTYTVEEFRKGGWLEPHRQRKAPAIRLSLGKERLQECEFNFDKSAIDWTVGTGTRSGSLSEYLEGCEFSGSTHLKHPFLIHLYAQHLMQRFVRVGLLYAELRGSPDGYVNRSIGFGFADACDCTMAALSRAQEIVADRYRGQRLKTVWLPQIFGENLDALPPGFQPDQEAVKRRFPVKISFIMVGKRHKAVTDMMLEAAAGAVLHQVDSRFQPMSASEFLEECRRCRVVGFDLAGSEADFPPGLFAREFQRLSKLNIPLTVHAGENASSRFVEEAILELGARRIGHGLSLADDKKLMALVREERICVEMCPVSNHQTCHFTFPGQAGRTYPLVDFLDAGIPVCINTDNPIISRTDIVKEYFMASKAVGGLSLWDALRLVKTGFRHAFLSLPVRKAMLEIVDQIIFDLFSDPAVQADLRELVEAHPI